MFYPVLLMFIKGLTINSNLSANIVYARNYDVWKNSSKRCRVHAGCNKFMAIEVFIL